MKFYESGETPRKNIEVMQEAMALAAEEQLQQSATEKKKKKKKRKAESDEVANGDDTLNGSKADESIGNGENGESKKKKKKKKNKESDE